MLLNIRQKIDLYQTDVKGLTKDNLRRIEGIR